VTTCAWGARGKTATLPTSGPAGNPSHAGEGDVLRDPSGRTNPDPVCVGYKATRPAEYWSEDTRRDPSVHLPDSTAAGRACEAGELRALPVQEPRRSVLSPPSRSAARTENAPWSARRAQPAVRNGRWNRSWRKAAPRDNRTGRSHRAPSTGFALSPPLEGKTVLDQFRRQSASISPRLTEDLRAGAPGWRGSSRSAARIGTSLVLLNCLVTGVPNVLQHGPAAFRPLPKHWFVQAPPDPPPPGPDAWLASVFDALLPQSAAATSRKACARLATNLPELVYKNYRNPEKISRPGNDAEAGGRASFLEFFGTDDWVFAPSIS